MHSSIMAKEKKKDRAPPQSEVDQIAARLRLGRIALSLTAAELCRVTGIKPNTYSQYESAKGRPRLDEARLMRRSLGYTLDWIYEGDRSGLPMKLAAKIAEIENGSFAPSPKVSVSR